MKIYIVLSTNENESDTQVRAAFTSELSAYKAEGEILEQLSDDENLEDDMESLWHVWIEEIELQD